MGNKSLNDLSTSRLRKMSAAIDQILKERDYGREKKQPVNDGPWPIIGSKGSVSYYYSGQKDYFFTVIGEELGSWKIIFSDNSTGIRSSRWFQNDDVKRIS